MGPIVCATHGGEASRESQRRAVALAKERDTELIFLYVVNPAFAESRDDAMKAAVADELQRLGRSLLGVAEARAREQGVKARISIRFGPVRDTIKEYLREVNAEVLVLGTARHEEQREGFDSEKMSGFAESVRQELNLEVITVEEERES